MANITSEVHESSPFSNLEVDDVEGVIRNVKILGYVSKHGRRYSDKAMREGFHKYENAPVNKNHDLENPIDRSISDRIGQIINVRYVVGEGLFGDFQLLLSDPEAPKILETARKMPSKLGFSHYAFCGWKSVNGVQEAQTIDRVVSVDLVSAPATTNGLHESIDHVVGECAKCKKMSSLSSNKEMKYGDKLKAIAEDYGISDDGDSDDKPSSKEDKGSASESFSQSGPVHKESAMAEPVVEQPVATPVAESTVEPKVETPVVAPAAAVAESSNSIQEIEHLCDVAGVKLEKAVMESLGAVPRANAVALIKRMALAESVEKPFTGATSGSSHVTKIDFNALRS